MTFAEQFRDDVAGNRLCGASFPDAAGTVCVKAAHSDDEAHEGTNAEGLPVVFRLRSPEGPKP